MPLQMRLKATDNLDAVLREAPPGTRIILPPGRYEGNIVLDRPLEITGDGSGQPVTLAAQQGSCLEVRAPQTLIWGLVLTADSDVVTLLDIQSDDVAVDECVLSGGETTVRIGSTNVTMNHCTILQGSVGLHLNQCGQVDIVDCKIQEHRDSGVRCTNLERYVRLINCDLSNNTGFGLSTSYFRHYAKLYGPELHHCSIHHNGTHGISITDEAWYTGLTRCRVFENAQAQISLGAEASLNECDIGGGQIGIAVTGGEPGMILRCKVHNMPVGIWVTGPHDAARDYTFVAGSSIYKTTDAAVRTGNGGRVNFLHCTVRDNTGVGVDIGRGTTQEARECRIARNAIGMLIRPEGVGRMEESVVTQNGTGIYAQAGSKVDAWYCHIEQHSGPAVVLEKDTKGNVADCTFRLNAAGDIRRDAESKVSESGDPQVDHLARRSVKIPPE